MDLNASILVDTIFLLINENSDYSRNIANELINLFKESKVVETDDSDVIRFYIRIIHRIISEKIDKTSMDELRSLMLKMKSEQVFASHKDLLLDLEKTLLDPEVMDAEKLKTLKRNIHLTIAIEKRRKKLKKSFTRLNRLVDEDNLDVKYKQFKEFEEEFGIDKDATTDNYSSAQSNVSLSLSDTEALRRVMEHHERNVSAEFILKTGRKGLNNAFGKLKGFQRGLSMIFIAPSGHGKSFALMDSLYWLLAYNTFVVEDGKKPLIYFVSTENGISDNMAMFYDKLYLEQYNTSVPESITAEDKITAIQQFIKETGVEVVIEHYEKTQFSCEDFVNKLAEFMEKGYYIPAAILDYLVKTNLPNIGREDLNIRAAYDRVTGFCKKHNIAFITGHQYTRAGMDKLTDKIDKVKNMNEAGISGGYDAFQAVDIAFFVFREANHQNEQFVTMYKCKHRYDKDTPEAAKYVAYKMGDGGIKDDINDPASRAVKDIYGEAIDMAATYSKQTASVNSNTSSNDDLF